MLSEYPLMIDLYCGPLVLSSLVVLRSLRSLYWGMVAILIYMLSLGDSGFLLPAVRSLLPFIGFFRYPEKMLLGIHLLASVACGLVLMGPWEKWRNALFCIGIISLIFILREWWVLILIPGILSLLVVKGSSSRVWIVTGLQTVILLFIHAFTYPTVAWDSLMNRPQIASIVAGKRVYVNEPKEGFPANEVDQALWRRDHLYQAWAGVFGVQNINTPSSLNLRAHDSIQEAIASSSKGKVGELFRSVGVSSVISPAELSGYDSFEFVAGNSKEGYVYSVSGVSNRSYFLEPGTGQRDDNFCSVESDQFSRPSSWEGRVSCVKPGVLVLPETAYPGWNVTVDTIDAPIVSLPHQLLGVALNPGTHDVRFSFTLEGIKVYAVVFILTALLDCLLIAQYIWQLLSRVRE